MRYERNLLYEMERFTEQAALKCYSGSEQLLMMKIIMMLNARKWPEAAVISNRTLAAECGLCSSTVNRSLRLLEAEGWLSLDTYRKTTQIRLNKSPAKKNAEAVNEALGVDEAWEAMIQSLSTTDKLMLERIITPESLPVLKQIYHERRGVIKSSPARYLATVWARAQKGKGKLKQHDPAEKAVQELKAKLKSEAASVKADVETKELIARYEQDKAAVEGEAAALNLDVLTYLYDSQARADALKAKETITTEAAYSLLPVENVASLDSDEPAVISFMPSVEAAQVETVEPAQIEATEISNEEDSALLADFAKHKPAVIADVAAELNLTAQEFVFDKAKRNAALRADKKKDAVERADVAFKLKKAFFVRGSVYKHRGQYSRAKLTGYFGTSDVSGIFIMYMDSQGSYDRTYSDKVEVLRQYLQVEVTDKEFATNRALCADMLSKAGISAHDFVHEDFGKTYGWDLPADISPQERAVAIIEHLKKCKALRADYVAATSALITETTERDNLALAHWLHDSPSSKRLLMEYLNRSYPEVAADNLLESVPVRNELIALKPQERMILKPTPISRALEAAYNMTGSAAWWGHFEQVCSVHASDVIYNEEIRRMVLKRLKETSPGDYDVLISLMGG